MKLLTIFYTLLLLITFTPAHAEESEYINELISLSEKLDTVDLWPGYHFNARPFIVEDDHLYAFNFLPKNSHWQKLTTTQQPIYYLPTDEIGYEAFNPSFSNPYLIVDEQSCTAGSAVEGYRPHYTGAAWKLVTSFENYEFFDAPQAKANQQQLLANLRYPYDELYKVESNSLVALEVKIIKDYLHTDNPELLKDYVAVNQRRDSLLSKATLDYENKSPLYHLTYMYNKIAYPTNKAAIKNLAEVADLIASFSFSLFEDIQELVTPTIELALDDLEPNWKQAVADNQSTPNEILAQHFHLDQSEIDTRVADAFVQYKYDAITENINNIFADHNQKMLAAQKKYLSTPGVELTFAVDDSFDADFKVDDTYIINTNKFLQTDLNSLDNYPSPYQFKHIPYVYVDTEYQDDFSVKYFATTKFPAESKLIIDGYTYTVGAFVSLIKHSKVSHLKISNTNASLEMNLIGGSLDVVDNKLVLSGDVGNKVMKMNRGSMLKRELDRVIKGGR